MKRIYFTITLLLACLLSTMAATITVLTNAGSGMGSLRQAIIEANDGDKIIFDQAFTIYLTSPIELGDKNITIDGNVNGELVKLDGNFLDEDNDWIDDDGVFTNLLLVISSGDYTVNINNMIIQNGSVSDDDWGGAWPSSDMYLGGGVYIDLTDGGTFTMTGCSIQNNVLSQMEDGYDGVNQAYLRGGGIYSEYGGAFVECTIKNNVCIAKNSYQCNMSGGGAYIYEGGSFTNCLIAGNRILFSPINDQNFYYGSGAGLDLFEKADIINCLIIGNCIKNLSSDYRGYSNQVVAGGIIALNAKVYNTTVVENSIENIYEITNLDEVGAGGAFITYRTVGSTEYSDYCDYQNNIFYGNHCSAGNFNNGGSIPKFTKYSAFPNADEYDEWNFDATNVFLDENPFFELPSKGDDGEWGTDDDNYGNLRLKENSPCIDAGNPDDTQIELTTFDFYGRERITNNIIDMGAVESLSTDFYYNLKGSVWEGTNQCTSGKVYAYSVDNTAAYKAVIDLDSDGNFEFESLEPGDYYLLAVSDNTQDYQSTFFGDETNIQKAISITVDDFIYDVDIHLVDAVTTSVDGVNGISFNIYPNPATSVVNINGNAAINKIKLYNSLGTLVSVYNGNETQISVSNLQSGAYVLSIEMEGKVLNYQVFKK